MESDEAEGEKKHLFFSLSGHSLTLRVGLLSTIWVTIALCAVAWVGAVLYRDANERNFERLLTAHLYSLVGSVNVSPRSVLQGNPELGDIRYADTESGWYWEVVAITPSLRGRLQSPSMGKGRIPSPSEVDVPFDSHFMRSYRRKGLQGQDIMVVESDIVLDTMNRAARFRVMGNLDEVKEQFEEFWATMRWYLVSLGLASMLINATIIVLGLRPLVRVRRALEAIRAGKSDRVDTHLPIEITPLAREMNALIDNNRRIVERFRTQVGNLAHSLKTPLAVLTNEASKIGGKKGDIIGEQAQAMQRQISHYLQRARIAAQRDSVVYRTDVKPVVERLIRVMRKLNPQKIIEFSANDVSFIFAGEKEDIEEVIGNLMENGGKWSKNTIRVSLQPSDRQDENRRFFEVIVEDDGPGLNDDEIGEALKRGRRLDESTPGTGLGLSIVVDTVREYGGNLTLDRSPLGGLRVRFTLPLAAK